MVICYYKVKEEDCSKLGVLPGLRLPVFGWRLQVLASLEFERRFKSNVGDKNIEKEHQHTKV